MESLYSTMGNQCMQGALQLSETLEIRMCLAWHLSPAVSYMPKTIKKIAQRWLTNHNVFRKVGERSKSAPAQLVLILLKSAAGQIKHD